jgi:periplasmic protein TonB
MRALNPAPSGPAGPVASGQLFSVVSGNSDSLFPARREAFIFSVAGQALIIALLTYFTCCVIEDSPRITARFPKLENLPLVFSARSGGGGGGNHDPLPDSRGNPPKASLDNQFVPPTVIVPKEMPKLPMEETVRVAPEVKFPEGGQIGDPSSQFSKWLSNGPGGPTGTGTGCCNGIGPSTGPGVGPGPGGIYIAGKGGVTLPQAIYSPEPNFSEEARKAKQQGMVTLLLVVGADGRPYNIRVRQSLGMGLDEEAINAVTRWRFKPATRNGQPVATQIEVEVDFHLY